MTKQKPAHLWKPGQSGNPNGRPVGAKQRLSEDFVEALLKDFCQHGASAIEACRVEKPEAYLTVISRVLPKDVNLKSDASEAFVKIWEAIANGLAERLATEQGQSEDLRSVPPEGNA
jgi:Family of unknown function (DUF5681)